MGRLFLTRVRADSDDERDDSSVISEKYPLNIWYYRSSDFHQLKGHVLRAGISYLEYVQEVVNLRKSTNTIDGSRHYLSQAGIFAGATSPTDEKALEDASTAIPSAIRLLSGWLGEQTRDESGLPLSLRMMSRGEPSGSRVTLDGLLNTNFRVSKIATHESCPPSLYRVGFYGLFHYAKLPDNHQRIYPLIAHQIARSLARVFEFLPDNWKDNAKELEDLLKRCGEDEMAMIQC